MSSGTVKNRPARRLVNHLTSALALGITALITTATCSAQPTSPGEIASQSVNRGALGPDFQTAFGYGYYTYINGIPNTAMFSGLPSEATAFFTFRTSIATTAVLPQNIDLTVALSSGATYDIYLDPAPKHDWSDPATFTRGTKVATFIRTGFILSGIGVAAYETFNSYLIFSQPFTFNGQTYDFKNFTPGLRTSNRFGRLPFPSGLKDFPVALSFTGTAVATQLPPKATTNAVAGPKGLSAYNREFSLDGSGSTSADGKALKYKWSKLPGSPALALSGDDTSNPGVQFSTPGLYALQLEVTDASGNSVTDTVKVNYVGGN